MDTVLGPMQFGHCPAPGNTGHIGQDVNVVHRVVRPACLRGLQVVGVYTYCLTLALLKNLSYFLPFRKVNNYLHIIPTNVYWTKNIPFSQNVKCMRGLWEKRLEGSPQISLKAR